MRDRQAALVSVPERLLCDSDPVATPWLWPQASSTPALTIQALSCALSPPVSPVPGWQEHQSWPVTQASSLWGPRCGQGALGLVASPIYPEASSSHTSGAWSPTSTCPKPSGLLLPISAPSPLQLPSVDESVKVLLGPQCSHL